MAAIVNAQTCVGVPGEHDMSRLTSDKCRQGWIVLFEVPSRDGNLRPFDLLSPDAKPILSEILVSKHF